MTYKDYIEPYNIKGKFSKEFYYAMFKITMCENGSVGDEVWLGVLRPVGVVAPIGKIPWEEA